jgi:hypothetical protein
LKKDLKTNPKDKFFLQAACVIDKNKMLDRELIGLSLSSLGLFIFLNTFCHLL